MLMLARPDPLLGVPWDSRCPGRCPNTGNLSRLDSEGSQGVVRRAKSAPFAYPDMPSFASLTEQKGYTSLKEGCINVPMLQNILHTTGIIRAEVVSFDGVDKILCKSRNCEHEEGI